MTEPFRRHVEPRAIGVRALVVGYSWSLSAQVTAPLTTVHLPPERAVLTTPGMIGLMERCITNAESASGASEWQSVSVEVRHRAGLRAGEELRIVAELDEAISDRNRWRLLVTSSDGRTIGEGVIVRVRM